MRFFEKYVRKGFILLTLAVLIFLIAAMVVFSHFNKKRIIEENREYLRDNAVQVSARIDDAISVGFDNIMTLSALVSQSLTSPEFDVNELRELVNVSVFDFMEFADKEGMNHNITGTVTNARDREYYLNAKAGNTGMELIFNSRATHETLLMFYSPIYYNDEFVGSLIGVFRASKRLTELLQSEYFGQTVLSYLATPEGRVVSSSEGFDPQEEFYVTMLASENEPVRAQIVRALEDCKTLNFTLERGDVGYCMVRLPENSFFLLQHFPTEAGEQMIRRANSLTYALVALLLALFIVLFILLVRFFNRQQENIEQAKRQAEEASEAKTRFLFNMSHDIRTPMNAILGFAEIALRHDNDRERVDDSLKKIKKSGEHLLDLINDILEMSRIESGSLGFSEHEVNLNESLDDVIQMSTALAEAKNIQLELRCRKIQDPCVFIDELRLKEVLINIISNAVKYTNPGGKVVFSAEQTEETSPSGRAIYRFSVEDNGIGMSEKFQKHLYESFSREERPEVLQREGSGLGLSIVKRILDQVGGEICVESKLGEGSKFTILVPMKVLEQDSNEAGKTKEKPAEKNTLVGKRVLLVEDNEMNREIAEEILSDAGLLTETAENGSVAVNLVVTKGTAYYDIILMDIQMPVMNGYEATKAIRNLPDGRQIPIIALSANAFQEDRAQSRNVGMNAHIAKPIVISELLDAMSRLSD